MRDRPSSFLKAVPALDITHKPSETDTQNVVCRTLHLRPKLYAESIRSPSVLTGSSYTRSQSSPRISRRPTLLNTLFDMTSSMEKMPPEKPIGPYACQLSSIVVSRIGAVLECVAVALPERPLELRVARHATGSPSSNRPRGCCRDCPTLYPAE